MRHPIATSSRAHMQASRRCARALAILLATLGLLLGLSPDLGATPGIAPTALAPGAKPPVVPFGAGPANAKGVDGRSYFLVLTAPKQGLNDHMAVVNLSLKPLTLNVYPVDALSNADGSVGFQPRTERPSDAGSWITIHTPNNRPAIVVKPRSTTILPFHIQIPAQATPGDHVAGLITSLTSKVKGPSSNTAFEQRVALRVFIRISGPLQPKLVIEQLRTTYHPTLNPFGHGSVTVSYTVRNAGNVILGGHQNVKISGLLNSRQPKALADVPLLLPGATYSTSMRIGRLWPTFSLTGSVRITPVAQPGMVDPGLRDFTAKKDFWAIPWMLILLIVVLVLAVTGTWWWRRHRRRRTQPPSPGQKMALTGPRS
jgi:hypothetical protein